MSFVWNPALRSAQAPSATTALAQHIRSAIAQRQPGRLQELLQQHGPQRFAQALALWSSRVVMDGLSLLPPQPRHSLLPHLPRDQRLQIEHRAASLVGRPLPCHTVPSLGTPQGHGFHTSR